MRAPGQGGWDPGNLGRRRTTAATALLACALAGGGCGPGDADEASAAAGDGLGARHPGAPVVIVSIDTLRSDRLPAYGYGGVEAPAIDGLVQDGILFERAYSHVPLTLPSHASLFSGLLPPDHGVRDNAGFRLESEAMPYLPRELRRAGYRTGAAVSSFVLRRESGLAAGFELYEDALARGAGRNERPGAETVARALDWLEPVRGEPFLLFVHLFEPHAPYEPPEPWASRYEDPYDGEIATADAAVGTLLARLRRWDLYDPAFIVLLSDHGEGLGDHGEQEHGVLLYREALQVPLVLKLPGGAGAGTRRREPVGLADVAPTLRALLGLDPGAPAPLLEGAGEGGIYAETYFPQIHLGWSGLTSWIDGRLHLIRGPRAELYDLVADPGETENLLPDRRADYRRLMADIEPWERPPGRPGEEDPETRRRLEALGYVGSPGGGLPVDPRRRIEVFEAVRRGVRALVEGRLADAVSRLEAVVAEHPEATAAWEHLGLALFEAGRLAEAAAAFERALAAGGGSPRIALGAARTYAALGRLEEARARAELALATEAAEAHGLLAEIALAAGDLGEAEAQARAALAVRPGMPEPSLVLAQVALARGAAGAALGHVQNARAAQERLPAHTPPLGLATLEGEALARLGRMDEAEAALDREISLHPRAARAYSLLASVYAFQGRAAEARAVVDRMLSADPTPATYAVAVSTLRAIRQPRQAEELLARARERFPDAPELAAGAPD